VGAATDLPAMHAGAATTAGAGYEAEVAHLRDEVAELRTMVERLREEFKK
jgi:uncharacterized protein YceH (UPF0502 family)